MKKLSDLAKTFQQKSQQEAKSIEQQLEKDIQELNKSIRAELKQSEQRIIADIQAKHSHIKKEIFQSYRLIWGLLITAILVLSGVNVYLTKEAQNQWKKYQTTQMDILKLENKLSKFKLKTCNYNNQIYDCIAIYPDLPAMWDNNNEEYRIIMPKEKN